MHEIGGVPPMVRIYRRDAFRNLQKITRETQSHLKLACKLLSRLTRISYTHTRRGVGGNLNQGDRPMFAKTAIALALIVAAVSSAVAAPKVYNSSGWSVGTDPSAQIRNYLQHDRGAE